MVKSKIVIKDIPQDNKLSKADLKILRGGLTTLLLPTYSRKRPGRVKYIEIMTDKDK